MLLSASWWPAYCLWQATGSGRWTMAGRGQWVYVLVVLLVAESQQAVGGSYVTLCLSVGGRWIIRDIVSFNYTLHELIASVIAVYTG